jgi:predicted MFS family arabinose efflux permease
MVIGVDTTRFADQNGGREEARHRGGQPPGTIGRGRNREAAHQGGGRQMTQHLPPPRGSRYGWVMVAVAFIFLGIGSGAFVSISVFLRPLSDELGWLRGQTTLAYLAGSVALGLGGIAMGHLADRYSTRRVVLSGVLVLGLSLLLLARQDALWHFYVLYILLGGLGAAAFQVRLLTNVGYWKSRVS